MRLINRLLATLLIATATLIAGCEKPAPLPNEKSMTVTYATLDGCWQLTMWQGTPMAEDTQKPASAAVRQGIRPA